jgi:ubiquitin-like protein Pup
MNEQKRKAQSSPQGESAVEAQDKQELREKGKKIGKELDALLDEIEGVLEENAAEFVASYVQQGGQ